MKKNQFILSAVCIVSVCSSFHYDTATFSGKWEYKTDQTVFSLTLTQKGKLISGEHCSTQYAGQRIDCCMDATDLPSVRGTAATVDSVNVSFKSCYSGKTGQATIKKISATRIRWIIKQEPKGEFYIPSNVILTKQ